MREIKYRAWLKREQKMYPVTGMIKSMVLLSSSEDMVTAIDIDQVELMQYTGLKDCKGTEIFEGDIVNILSSIAAEVYWDFGAWQLRNGDKAGGQLGSVIAMDDMAQVIGNVYEHPHLLEQ